MSRKALLQRLSASKPSPVLGPLLEFFQGVAGPYFYTRQSMDSMAVFETVLIAQDQTAIVTGRFGLN